MMSSSCYVMVVLLKVEGFPW